MWWWKTSLEPLVRISTTFETANASGKDHHSPVHMKHPCLLGSPAPLAMSFAKWRSSSRPGSRAPGMRIINWETNDNRGQWLMTYFTYWNSMGVGEMLVELSMHHVMKSCEMPHFFRPIQFGSDVRPVLAKKFKCRSISASFFTPKSECMYVTHSSKTLPHWRHLRCTCSHGHR